MKNKKLLLAMLVIILLSVGTFFGYEYVSEPKIVDGVMSKNIDEQGKPVELTSTFSPEETVYFSAKRNRFWINKAEIVWYKGEITKKIEFMLRKKYVLTKQNISLQN